MNDVIEGIVISVNDYKDNDAIINILTKEYGKLALYVRGQKKVSGKNIYATQLLNRSSFMFDYYPNRNMQHLKSATLIDTFSEIRNDYEKITIASLICEITDKCATEDIYDLLLKSLENLNKSDQPYLILNIFLSEILSRLGISPYVDGCVLCGRSDDIETISLEDGGFLCRKCNQGENKAMTPSLLMKFRYINKAKMDIIDKLVNLNLNEFELVDIMMNILVIYSGIRVNSYKSLTNLNS